MFAAACSPNFFLLDLQLPSKIIFQSSWYLIVACLAFALIVSSLLYYKNKRNNELSNRFVFILFLLRFSSTFLISTLLLNILFQNHKNETEKPVILIALDNSLSLVSNPDSNEVKSLISENISSLEKEIQKKYQTKTIHFGKEAKAKQEELNFSEKESDFENLFNSIDNNYANQNIGALVFLSDGIYNKGTNPLNNINKFKFPIYSIAVGDTNQYQDIFIRDINHNEVAYLGNNFAVEINVGAKKIVKHQATINLFFNNKVIQSKPININKDNFLASVIFTLSANEKGLQAYKAQVSYIDGEKNVSNNQKDFTIDVIDNKEKILLLSNSPHPDIAALKQSIESKSNYSLACENGRLFNSSYLKPYALIIIHGFNNNQVKLINECKNQKIPFWIINPETTDNLPGVKLNVSLNKFNENESYIDENFSLFTISPELKKFVKEAPALKTNFGNYTGINSASSLIKQKIGQIETENPILIFSEYNNCKCATFIGEGLWKWRMRNFVEKGNQDLFNELVSKTVQYLSVKKDKSFFRIKIPNKLFENEALEIQAELYNQSYELINEAELSFNLQDSSKHEFDYVFSKKSNAYALNIGLLKPGTYTYRSTVKFNGEVFTKQGKIIVSEVALEKNNLVANHQLLIQLANKTEGQFFHLKDLSQLKQALLNNENIKSITYSEIQESYLIDLKWWFVIILLLLSLEWLLRKNYLII
jgi:hypothetical protein